MAHTDKTRPEWVQLHDPANRGWIKEFHNHVNRDCDLHKRDPKERWWWGRSDCHFRPTRHTACGRIYSRKAVKYYAYSHTRKERATWREVKSKVLKGNLDAADQYPRFYNHRHSGIWDSY